VGGEAVRLFVRRCLWRMNGKIYCRFDSEIKSDYGRLLDRRLFNGNNKMVNELSLHLSSF